MQSKSLAAPLERAHGIVQFAELPDAPIKDTLEDAGVRSCWPASQIMKALLQFHKCEAGWHD
jgi:hypothetical protein